MTESAPTASSESPLLPGIEEGGLIKTNSSEVRGRAAKKKAKKNVAKKMTAKRVAKKTARKKSSAKREATVEAQQTDTSADEAAPPSVGTDPAAAPEAGTIESIELLGRAILLPSPQGESPEAAAASEEAEPEPTDAAESPEADDAGDPEEAEDDDTSDENEDDNTSDEAQPEAEAVATPERATTLDDVAATVAARETGLTPRTERRRRRQSAKADATVSTAVVPPAPRPAPSPPQQQPAPAPRDELRVFTARDAAPPMDEPLHRDGMTIGLIEPAAGESFPDVSGRRGPPANLTDICHDYKIGEGACYVRVERLKPVEFQGRRYGGCIGELHFKLTEAEFRDLCGGGIYELIVYGPDPRGKLDEMDQPTIKALTKGIKLSYPGVPFWVNFDELTGPLERQGADMHRGWSPSQDNHRGGGSRMPPTTADASMHRDNLTTISELHKDERDERRRVADQLEQERSRQRSAPGTSEHVLNAVSEAGRIGIEATQRASDGQTRLLQAQMERQERVIEELRQDRRAAGERPTEASSAMDAFVRMTEASKPGRHSGEEIQRMHDVQRDEMTRVTESHARQTEEMSRRHADQLKLKDDELDRERRRTENATKDSRDEAERRERNVREEMDRRVKDTEERFKWQLTQQDAAHKRELESQQNNASLLRDTNKVSHDTRVETLRDQVQSANAETERARADADNKSDFTSQMEEFEAKAGLMGYEKNGGVTPPNTWQERMAASLGAAIENSDKTLESLAGAFRARGEAAQQQTVAMRTAHAMNQPPQPRHLPPPPQQAPPTQRRVIRGAGGQPRDVQRSYWAQDGSPPISQTHPVAVSQAEGMPEAIPQPSPGTPTTSQRIAAREAETQQQPVPQQPESQQPVPQQPVPQQPVPQQPVPQQPVPQQPQPQQPQQPVPPMQQPPVQQVAPAPVQQQAPPPQGALAPTNGMDGLDDAKRAQLEQFREVLEEQFGQGVPATGFAEELYKELGSMGVQAVVTQASADMVIYTLSTNPKAAGSPLLSRDGQVWLKEVWRESERLVNQPN